MAAVTADVEEQLRALAAVLTVVCGRLDAIAARLPDDEPGLEGEVISPGLRSLIGCVLTDSIEPAIRDLLCAAEQEPARPAAAPDPPRHPPEEPGYEALWSRLEASLPRLLAARETERRETERLFVERVSASPAERRTALADARFHRLALVDRLLDGARSALPSAPAAAEELATLGTALSERLADAAEAMEGRARAACSIAHARRIAGDLAGAEQALSAATLYAVGADEQAELCRALALLRWEQGRQDEAAALLERAAELWAEEGVVHEVEACRLLRALLMVDAGHAREAVGILRDSLPLSTDPVLTVCGGLALALGLAEQGQAERARRQRAESERLAPTGLPHYPPTHLFALRLEGEIALSLGEDAAAARMLDALRRDALAHRLLPEAAVATLDLARLDTERGDDRAAAEERAAELAAAFAGTDDLAGVLAALRQFPELLPEGESLPQPTASLAALFLRLLRLRGVPRRSPSPEATPGELAHRGASARKHIAFHRVFPIRLPLFPALDRVKFSTQRESPHDGSVPDRLPIARRRRRRPCLRGRRRPAGPRQPGRGGAHRLSGGRARCAAPGRPRRTGLPERG